MKPLSITMQGFGSYIHPTTVDFSSLGENPIFLITGATGGGKTTILDAMCFALYCKATGNRRSWTSMRSTAAEDSLSTSVDFSFRLGNDVYRFCRSQSIYYVRGSGRRDRKEEHLCYRLIGGNATDETAQWDLLLSGSETKVREYAEQLLGLTCEQFSQVIVLPQGDFLKLLRANSKEKAEILQTLFGTQIWTQLTDKMKKHANTLFQEVGELHATKSALLEREGVETIEGLAEKCKQSASELKIAQSNLKQLQSSVKLQTEHLNQAKELQQRFIQHKELVQKKYDLEQLATSMEQKKQMLVHAKQIELLYPYWQNHRAAKQTMLQKQASFQQAEESLKQAKQHLDTLQKQQDIITQKRNQISQLEQTVPKLETALQAAIRLETLYREQSQIKCAIEQNNIAQIKIETEIGTAEENIQKGNDYLKTIEKELQLLPTYIEQLHTLENYQQLYQLLAKAEDEHRKATSHFIEITQAKQQKEKLLLEKKNEVAKLQAHFMEHTASLLAKDLKENDPCPVCGSTHHPAPVSTTVAQTVESSQLTELTTQLEQLQSDYESYLQTYSHAQAVFEEKKRIVAENTSLCTQIPIPLAELTAKLEVQKSQVQEAEKTVALRSKAEERVSQRKKQLIELQQQRETQKEELAKRQQQLSSITATIKELQHSTNEQQNVEIIEQELNKTRTFLQTIQIEISQWDAEFLKANSHLAAQQTNLENAASTQTEAMKQEQRSKDIFIEQLALTPLVDTVDSLCDLNAMRISQQEILNMEEDLQSYTTQMQTVSEQLKQLESLLKDKTMPAIAELENQLTQIQEQHDNLAQQVGSHTQHLQMSQKALEQIQTITSNSKEAEGLYEQASHLYQLLSGGNQKKVALQQFVLGIMLDDILTYANEFFSLLSRGRYSLRRLEGTTGGNAKSGLDLEVLDGYTGAPRSIETLSGGEQFLASLSLAFGLSDVVQSYSGSVRLDSIFIDEGFGSLDQDTLDTAMKALAQIQKMGRTVGIISHVSELKNRIATQIQVHPSKNGGSSITIIIDN